MYNINFFEWRIQQQGNGGENEGNIDVKRLMGLEPDDMMQDSVTGYSTCQIEDD